MRNELRKRYAKVVGIALVLAAWLMVPPAGAQQFSGWSAPVNLNLLPDQMATPINTASDDQHMAISKDGLSLYFASNRPGGCGEFDIWVTQRASVDSPWEEPFNLDAPSLAQGLSCKINSSARDFAPNLTTDGHRLFFHNFRANDNCGGGDIYYAHRENRRDDVGWEPPVNLNRYGRDPDSSLICGGIGDFNFVNTSNTDAGPNYFQDEDGTTVLYFTRSDQPTTVGDFDIYRTTLAADGTWGTVVRENELSMTGFRDTRTAIRRRDGLEMIISSERPGGLGTAPRDLWVSTRASTQDAWSIPELLPNVNSTALEGAPALSWDGTALYFFSARAGGAGGTDIYLSTRTKITGNN
jgi:hypothetical protein